jgi:aminopeptidase N
MIYAYFISSIKRVIMKTLVFTVLFLVNFVFAQSGGPLDREQAAYDVKYYELELNINPISKSINGSLLCTAEITDTISRLVLDLDNPFTIDSILFNKGSDSFSRTTFTHLNGKVYVTFPVPVIKGDLVSVKIHYWGTPKISSSPPWSSGFVWKTTPGGKPWIGVTCEDEGADIWWPCKDHPSDEPDSMALSFTVPNPLICVSNGRFTGSTDNGNNTSTFNWFISTPINNYNVTFYISEYSLISETFISINGDSVPFFFWVIPESYTKAVNYMNVFRKEFSFLESVCGPFPFSTDKLGWAHSPYYGMEHQTIIAYGNNFTLNSWGYDYIHFHELAHEWWGNLITAKDWSDVWIHEGIATYTEYLYVEHLYGKTAYKQMADMRRPANNHTAALAPRQSLTAEQAFNNLNPYYRGASVMHTLRYHLGDELFFKVLKGWAYPDSNDTDNTNGRLCRILTTDDMKIQAELISGVNLDAFFEVFFREAQYPKLRVSRGSKLTTFTWETMNNIPLDVDVPVVVNGISRSIKMTNGTGSSAIPVNADLVIDPERWLLMDQPVITGIEDDESLIFNFDLEQNYPNPFNPETTINFSLPLREFTELIIYDLLGNEVEVLLKDYKDKGQYDVSFNGTRLPSGIYFCEMKAGNFTKTQKMLLIK